MIPMLVPRKQLLSANGIFTLTLNAAFALGFTLVGPLIVKIAGAPALIARRRRAVLRRRRVLLDPAVGAARRERRGPTGARGRVREAEHAVGSVLTQLGEGLGYIRGHREIRWSLIYLGIAASLVGVLGVLGPNFAENTLGLGPEDFVVVVLPLGVGIVMGILLLNAYGRLIPRRRVIEGGLIALGVFLARWPCRAGSAASSAARRRGPASTCRSLTSLLSIVVAVAFFAGIAYAAVAIPAQTQLQEDLPEDVRGRVFGVLNMLVSVASFLPILVVGPIADLLGTTIVLVVVAILIGASGVASIYLRGPLRAVERDSRATVGTDRDPFVTALGVELAPRTTPDMDGEPIAGWPAMTVRTGRSRSEPSSRPPRIRSPPTADPIDPDGATRRQLAIEPGRADDRRRGRRRTRRPRLVRLRRPWPRVAVVFTGGTISMRHDPVAGGNVPVLGGAAMLATVPGLDAIADLVPIDRGLTPASHFTFDGAVRDRGRPSARPSPTRRSTAPSSSRARTRSRRRRSSSTCSTPARSRSSSPGRCGPRARRTTTARPT